MYKCQLLLGIEDELEKTSHFICIRRLIHLRYLLATLVDLLTSFVELDEFGNKVCRLRTFKEMIQLVCIKVQM